MYHHAMPCDYHGADDVQKFSNPYNFTASGAIYVMIIQVAKIPTSVGMCAAKVIRNGRNGNVCQ